MHVFQQLALKKKSPSRKALDGLGLKPELSI